MRCRALQCSHCLVTQLLTLYVCCCSYQPVLLQGFGDFGSWGSSAGGFGGAWGGSSSSSSAGGRPRPKQPEEEFYGLVSATLLLLLLPARRLVTMMMCMLHLRLMAESVTVKRAATEVCSMFAGLPR